MVISGPRARPRVRHTIVKQSWVEFVGIFSRLRLNGRDPDLRMTTASRSAGCEKRRRRYLLIGEKRGAEPPTQDPAACMLT